MTNEKKTYIAEQVRASAINFQGLTSPLLSDLGTKSIHLFCDCKMMDDSEIIGNLHSIKLDFVKIGKQAYEAVEAIKALLDSNPDQPDLPLTNEDLQDDNPIEEDEHA